MNIEQLINNRIFCATTRLYAYLTEVSAGAGDNKTAYVNLEEIIEELNLSENTVRNALRKLISNNLIEMGDKKYSFILKKGEQ